MDSLDDVFKKITTPWCRRRLVWTRPRVSPDIREEGRHDDGHEHASKKENGARWRRRVPHRTPPSIAFAWPTTETPMLPEPADWTGDGHPDESHQLEAPPLGGKEHR
jgi:hypothetical protein